MRVTRHARGLMELVIKEAFFPKLYAHYLSVLSHAKHRLRYCRVQNILSSGLPLRVRSHWALALADIAKNGYSDHSLAKFYTHFASLMLTLSLSLRVQCGWDLSTWAVLHLVMTARSYVLSNPASTKVKCRYRHGITLLESTTCMHREYYHTDWFIPPTLENNGLWRITCTNVVSSFSSHRIRRFQCG